MSTNSFLVQYAAGICATLTVIPQGIVMAWPSPAIPKLKAGEAGDPFTTEQCSWIASIASLGAIVGCFAGQYLADAVGRKKTIILANIPMLIGMLMIIFISTPIPLYVARFLLGGAGAISIVITSIYTGEISDKKIRGALGTLLMIMWICGNLLMYTIGPYVTYQVLNYICISITVLVFLSCLWIPESPYYYLKIDDVESAKKELLKLKRLKSIKPIENELRNIQIQIKSDMEKKTSIIELLKKQEYRKAVKIIGGLKIVQIVSGGMVIQTYLESIFKDMDMAISTGIGSIIYGVVQLIAGLLGTVLVDRMGRRPLLLISAIGSGISLVTIGAYFYVKAYVEIPEDTLKSWSWTPVASMLAFVVFYSIGIGNLPYVLQSELFPTNVKSAASSLGTIFGATMGFALIKSYQGAVDALGIHNVFWIFSGVTLAGSFFIHFQVPETKGKTLEEIGLLLRGENIDLNGIREIQPLENK